MPEEDIIVNDEPVVQNGVVYFSQIATLPSEDDYLEEEE